MGKNGFEFKVVLPYLIKEYCHFIIISRCGNGFVVVLKRGKILILKKHTLKFLLMK